MRFCVKVQPYPIFWQHVRKTYPDLKWTETLLRDVINWLTATAAVFTFSFGIGQFLFQDPNGAALLWVMSAILWGIIWYRKAEI